MRGAGNQIGSVNEIHSKQKRTSKAADLVDEAAGAAAQREAVGDVLELDAVLLADVLARGVRAGRAEAAAAVSGVL